MKETKIAKENIEDYKRNKKYKHLENLSYGSLLCCDEHKQICERDVPKLKKLKHLLDCCTSKKAYQNYLDEARELVDKNLEDKEQAIKLYEENGI